jgi:hypothetical protein
MANEIKIGKGESKSIIFKITDKDNIFIGTDKLLFAVKFDATSKNFLFSKETLIGSLTPEIVVIEGVEYKQYSFLVQITTETSRSLQLGNYYYDLTLIDTYGEEKPLTTPTAFEIIKTIGASLEKVGS